MTRVVLDTAVLAKLTDTDYGTEVCNEAGETVGFFYPLREVGPEIYEKLVVPISQEEIERRSREPGGRSLAEIMADLHKRA